MTIYAGFDVLDQTEHNRIGPRPGVFRRALDLFDPRTGAREADDKAGAPAVQRAFIWFAEDRTAVNALRTFLDARKGRAVPFWVPSFQRDLVLTTAILSGATTVTVENVGYTQLVFPRAGVRRHLRIAAPGLAAIFREIGSATDGGATETLGLTSAVTPEYPVTSLVSWLTLCRMVADDVEWTWRSRDVAEATFEVVELVNEYP